MTDPSRIWRTAERCRISYQGRTVDGAIKLASKNGKSLMLEFEALLGGYMGMMPVSWAPGGYLDLIQEKPVTLEPVPEEPKT